MKEKKLIPFNYPITIPL